MKARFFALMALVLGMASCQTDMVDGVKVDANGEAAVTLQVGLPADATRADSALGAIDNQIDMSQYDIRFILAVYDANGDLAKGPMVKHGDAESESFTFRLVPGRKYHFVAWADFVLNNSDADLHYDTTEFPVVSLMEGDAQNLNDESRDAYTQVVTVDDFSGASSIPQMVLTRPFAKLRVITTDMDQLYSNLKTTEVEYTSKIYTSFNALSSAVEGAPVLIAAKKVSYSKDYAGYVYGGPEGGEMTLFADYLFGSEDDRVMFDMDVDDETDFTIPTVQFNTNIPVQRNHLTTVKGNVLTDANNITVTIDNAFETPNIDVEWKEVSTAQELQEVINATSSENETHIVLTGDINLNDLLDTRAVEGATLVIEKGKVVDIDLGGFTLCATDTTEKNYELIKNAGTLVVKNGTMKVEATVNSGWNRYSAVIANIVGGNLTVDGVEIEHMGGTDMAYGIDNLTNGKSTYAVTTIKNSTVKSPYRAVRQFLNGVEATNELYVKAGTVLEGANKSIFFHDPSNKANTGKLVVEEGAELYGDVYLYVTAGSTEWPVEVSIASSALVEGSQVVSGNVPAGYFVVEKDGNYIVDKGLVINDKEYIVLSANGLVALAEQGLNAGDKVMLGANIDLDGVEFNGLDTFHPENGNTFDGQGYTVSNWTNNSGASDMGFIRNWVGTVKNVKFENCHLKTGGRSAIAAAKVYGNIENVTINNCSIEDSYWASGLVAGLYNAGNISGCTVTNSSVKSNGGTGAIVGVINETAGTRKVENCKVEGCTVNNTGAYGAAYSGALFCGMINISNSTVEFNGCSYENNTKVGKYVGDLFYGADEDITVNIAGAAVVNSAATLTEALSAGENVVLAADIDCGTTQLAISGANQVVNLNGHTLKTQMSYGGMAIKNGASIMNGTIEHTSTVAAIKAFNVGSIENVTIKTTCTTADKTITAIAVQQGGYVGAIKNVNIEGVSQGIEVGYQATVNSIENTVVNEHTNGTANGIGLVINGGKVVLAKNSTFKGDAYGVTMHLKGVFAVGLALEDCDVEGTTASIYAWDEKGISNVSGSLNLTYDAATTLVGPFVWDFEEECQDVVTLNRPE